jgi:hypothetical protein
MTNLKADAQNPGTELNSPTGFKVIKNPGGLHTLNIWGRLPPDWMGNLSSGLSKNRINIISATAKKTKVSWSAEFEIMPDRFAEDPDKLDFLALAKSAAHSDAAASLSLEKLVVGEPDTNDGALYLEITARDQLGFLGALLGRLAFFSLFPETMIIETTNGRIFDRFWIKGVGGSIPSGSAIKSVRQKLGSYVAQ